MKRVDKMKKVSNTYCEIHPWQKLSLGKGNNHICHSCKREKINKKRIKKGKHQKYNKNKNEILTPVNGKVK